MAIASGIEKLVVVAPQVTKGTVAVANLATAQYMRRVTSSLDLNKETYQSNEIRPDRQVGDFRHGVQSIDGNINGELSPETYDLLMAAVLRKDFVAAAASGAESDVECTVVSGAIGTFTSAATATYLTDGIKIGDVGRWTGWTTTGIDNNDRNFLVTAVSELVITGIFLDGDPADAKVAGDAVTFTGVGKKTWTPITGHTEDWFSIEQYYGDVDLSEVFYDCKASSMSINLPATGMATIDVGIMGLNHNFLATGDSPYFTSVVAATTTGVLAAVNGVITAEGSQIALITSINFDANGGQSGDPVVGSNVKPDLFDGKVSVSGSMSIYFEDATFRDYFKNETEVSVACVLTASNESDAEFLAFAMPRVKMGGASKDDGEKGIIQTVPFTALFDVNAGGDTGGTATDTLATTLSIQDSTL